MRKSMRRNLFGFGAALVLSAGMILAAQPAGSSTFTGTISDSACGLQHTLSPKAKDCTLMCVQMGSKFVLADEAHHIVYALSAQKRARALAGEKVRVVGILKRSTIQVTSISAAK